MIRSDSKFEIGDENLPCESSSPLPLPTPTHHPVIDSVHTRHLHFYLPCILTISSISSLSVCSVGNPFKKSFQIVRYNIHRLCCYITFKNQKYRMLIVNLRSFECLVWVLCRIWKWQHIRKREIAFCTIVEFFNVPAFDLLPLTSKGRFPSPISNFESPPTSTFANKYAVVRSFASSSVAGCSEKSTVNTKIQFFGPSLDEVMLIYIKKVTFKKWNFYQSFNSKYILSNDSKHFRWRLVAEYIKEISISLWS